MKKISKSTIIRTILLILALINQGLTISGHAVLPFTDEQVTEFLSMLFTGVTAVIAWWKNNSFTAEAQAGDNLKNALKEGAVKIEDLDDDIDDEELDVVEEPTEE